MTKELQGESGILDAVYEIASDLHNAGFIDKRRMAEYEALCLQPVPEFALSGIGTI